MSVDGVLERLAAVLRGAPGVPLSASCLVNRAEVLALVETARADLPVEFEDAAALLGRREAVMGVAEREAAAVVGEARREAAGLVENSAVVFRARIRAKEIVDEAQERADAVRREADQWCDRKLAGLEGELERALGQLRRGRELLEGRLLDQTDPVDPPPEAPSPGQLVIDLREGRPELGTLPHLQ